MIFFLLLNFVTFSRWPVTWDEILSHVYQIVTLLSCLPWWKIRTIVIVIVLCHKCKHVLSHLPCCSVTIIMIFYHIFHDVLSHLPWYSIIITMIFCHIFANVLSCFCQCLQCPDVVLHMFWNSTQKLQSYLFASLTAEHRNDFISLGDSVDWAWWSCWRTIVSLGRVHLTICGRWERWNEQTNYFKRVTNYAFKSVLHSALPCIHLSYGNYTC